MNYTILNGIIIVITVFLGFFGIITQKNLIKKLLMLGVMNVGVIGFFIYIVMGDLNPPPILFKETAMSKIIEYSDPLPQALVITAVVIGFATQSLSLVFVMIASKRFHSIDEEKIEIMVERERKNEL